MPYHAGSIIGIRIRNVLRKMEIITNNKFSKLYSGRQILFLFQFTISFCKHYVPPFPVCGRIVFSVLVQGTIWSPHIPGPNPIASSWDKISESSWMTAVASKIYGWLDLRNAGSILPAGSVTSYVGRSHVTVDLPPPLLLAVIVKNKGVPPFKFFVAKEEECHKLH